jgi:hypothetical protein
VTDDPDLRDIFRLPPDAGRLLAMALARLVEAFECNPGRAEMVLQWEGLIGRHSRNQNRLGPEDEISVDLSEEYALRTSAETMLHRGHAQTFEYEGQLHNTGIPGLRTLEHLFIRSGPKRLPEGCDTK